MTKRMATCPRCHGDWYRDLEPESGMPYACFRCGNTGLVPSGEIGLSGAILSRLTDTGIAAAINAAYAALDGNEPAEMQDEYRWLLEQFSEAPETAYADRAETLRAHPWHVATIAAMDSIGITGTAAADDFALTAEFTG